MTRRAYGFAVALALAVASLTWLLSYRYNLPLRDPDGLAGPSYIRLPLVVLLFYLADVVPRALIANRGVKNFTESVKSYSRKRWTRSRWSLVLVGLFTFYIVYVGYRNLKGFLPAIRYHVKYDTVLLKLDRAFAFGHDPATVLHHVLGVGIAAQVLALVYVFFLIFVPLSLGAALVWSKNVATGFWYVTALCINWVLGVASYYWVPSVGPFISNAKAFVTLPHTGVTSLQAALLQGRESNLEDPHATDSVQGVAAFASLHVSVIFTASLICWFVIPSRMVRVAMWVYFVLTVISTIYFGWHYILDDIAGFAIGLLSVWIGAKTTGHPMGKQRYLGATGDGVIGVFPPQSAPTQAEAAGHHQGQPPDSDDVGEETAPEGSTKDTAPA
jgi:membrane-associated phospholipid phosphatase